jgi:hypothetical protein
VNAFVDELRAGSPEHRRAMMVEPPKPLDPMQDVQPWEYIGNKAHPTEKAVSILRPLIDSFSRSEAA